MRAREKDLFILGHNRVKWHIVNRTSSHKIDVFFENMPFLVSLLKKVAIEEESGKKKRKHGRGGFGGCVCVFGGAKAKVQ